MPDSPLCLPLHLGDYETATRDLSMLEHGAYFCLLRWYYANGGPIPADLERAYRRCGAVNQHERAAVRSVLERFFVENHSHWHNGRSSSEIERMRIRRQQAQSNAKSGWNSRKNKGPSNGPASAPASDPNTQTTSGRNAMPLTLTKELLSPLPPSSYPQGGGSPHHETPGGKKGKPENRNVPGEKVSGDPNVPREKVSAVPDRAGASVPGKKVPLNGSARWWQTDEGIMARAVALGVAPMAGETYRALKARLFEVQKKRGAETPP